MKYYSKYSFVRNDEHDKEYILTNIIGKTVDNFEMAEYKKGNNVGKKYIRMEVPRSPNMRKYFAYTFEMSYGVPFTSTEALNEWNQTFGDGKKLGSSDLILFQFDKDLDNLDVYFVKNAARNVSEKKVNFFNFTSGASLELSAS